MKPRLIRPGRSRAREIATALRQSARQAIEHHGDDLGGFALVAWDMRGGVHSSMSTRDGPISDSLAPTYTKDALERHAAVRVVRLNRKALLED